MRPPLRYAKTVDGGNVAFTVVGEGYPYINITGGWLHNLALDWATPGVADYWGALSKRFKLVCLEPRGGPNSDWPPAERKYRDYVLDDIDAVLGELAIDRCAMAASDYCVQELAEYATTRPDSVSHLLLLGPATDTSVGMVDWGEFDRAQGIQAKNVGEDEYLFKARALLPHDAHRDQVEAFARLYRAADTPRGAALGTKLNERNRAFDLSPFLDRIRQKTLVVAGLGDTEACRELAASIDGSTFVSGQSDPGRSTNADDHELIAEGLAQFVYGRNYVPRQKGSVDASGDALKALSPRELEILALIAAGHSNQEIGESLVLSASTVSRHVANVYAKLGIHNRAQATAAYFGVANEGSK